LAALFGVWRRSIDPALAVLGGGVLIGISFWAIRGSVDDFLLRGLPRRSADGAKAGRKTRAFTLVKFFTRHGIVALAAYGMMARLRLDPVGLLTGVSALGLAVAVEALRDVRWRRFL
jgi:hypothetical protein